MRQIILNVAPEHQEAFAVALGNWLDIEPLAKTVDTFAGRVKVGLMDLYHGDGPNVGRLAEDRPRAARLLREMIPANVIQSASVDGVDWRYA